MLDCCSTVAVTLSIRYDGARLLCILCISREREFVGDTVLYWQPM